MKKNHKIATLAIVIFALFALSACSDEGKESSDSSSSTSTTSGKTPDTQVKSSSKMSESNAKATIDDSGVGYLIEVNKVIRDVAFNSNVASDREFSKGVLVEVTIKNDSDYDFPVIGNYFALLPDGEDFNSDNFTDDFTDYAKANNYTFLDNRTGVQPGETKTVWLAFTVYKDAINSDFCIVYTRNGITKADGTQIPQKELTVKISE